jgi:hypothetical protein
MHQYMLNPIGLRNNCAMQMPLQKKLKLFVSGIVSHRHGDIYIWVWTNLSVINEYKKVVSGEVITSLFIQNCLYICSSLSFQRSQKAKESAAELNLVSKLNLENTRNEITHRKSY